MKKIKTLGVIKTKDFYVPNGKSRMELPVSNDIYTFDIEVSSLFYVDGEFKSFDYSLPPEYYQDIEKVSCPYIWQFSVNDTVYYGREFMDFEKVLKNIYEDNCYKIIYVHNLSYEMQFLCNIFIGKYEITNMVCRDIHKPISFEVPELHVIFRCSYMLTNMSLESSAKKYTSLQKKSGDLDYNKARSPLTELTETELSYCEYDCLCVYEIIKYFKEKYGSVFKIPLTNTSIVRQELKKRVDFWYMKKRWSNVPTPAMYLRLMACFSGGYTHANILNSFRIHKDVHSQDIASSYPAVMVTEKYPVKPFIKCHPDQYTEGKKKYYAFIMLVHFENVKPKYYNHYMQVSKCLNLRSPVVDNGRIVSCKSCDFWCTDVDFDILISTYKLNYTIVELYKAKKDYLDIKVIKFILELYGNKTKLKIKAQSDPYIADVYMTSKAQINSLYGLSVSNVLNQSSDFQNGLWTQQELTKEFIEEKLSDAQKSWSTLIDYFAGIYVTSYARRNLFMQIIKIDTDMIYSDTDSIKYLGDHQDIFDEYNKGLIDKYNAVIKRYPELTLDDFQPEDENGVKRPIGAYEYEGKSNFFCTTGAKKYCTVKNGKINITIAGVNKKTGASRINKIEDFLEDNLTFDYYQSGRLIHYYLDSQPHFTFKDIDGNTYTNKLNYGIVLQPTTYTMGVTENYIELLKFYEKERAIKNGKQKTTIC